MMRYWLIIIAFAGMATMSDSATAAENFGRLFTTPAERSNLDYLRQTSKVNAFKESETASPEETDAPPTPANISVQGYVKRNDGKKGTVWVNNKPMQENSANSDVEVGKLDRDGNDVRVKLPSTGKSLNLKAGQIYTPETDTVGEVNAHSKSSAKAEDEGPISGDAPASSPTNQNKQ